METCDEEVCILPYPSQLIFCLLGEAAMIKNEPVINVDPKDRVVGPWVKVKAMHIVDSCSSYPPYPAFIFQFPLVEKFQP